MSAQLWEYLSIKYHYVGVIRMLTMLQSVFAKDFEQTLVEHGWTNILVLDFDVSQLQKNRHFLLVVQMARDSDGLHPLEAYIPG
jgi:hypothetical protein